MVSIVPQATPVCMSADLRYTLNEVVGDCLLYVYTGDLSCANRKTAWDRTTLDMFLSHVRMRQTKWVAYSQGYEEEGYERCIVTMENTGSGWVYAYYVDPSTIDTFLSRNDHRML